MRLSDELTVQTWLRPTLWDHRDQSESVTYVPVQITLIGSDGKGYTFLAKPKDDLRKDHRMMEVAGVINRLFAREPVSRRRNLYLRRSALCMRQNAWHGCHLCRCTAL